MSNMDSRKEEARKREAKRITRENIALMRRDKLSTFNHFILNLVISHLTPSSNASVAYPHGLAVSSSGIRDWESGMSCVVLMRPSANSDICTCPIGYTSEAVPSPCNRRDHHRSSTTIFHSIQAGRILLIHGVHRVNVARHLILPLISHPAGFCPSFCAGVCTRPRRCTGGRRCAATRRRRGG